MPDRDIKVVRRGGGAFIPRGPSGRTNRYAVTLRDAGAERLDSAPKVDRNAPCPCGSGAKAKRCHPEGV